jgi:hypothetical protein
MKREFTPEDKGKLFKVVDGYANYHSMQHGAIVRLRVAGARINSAKAFVFELVTPSPNGKPSPSENWLRPSDVEPYQSEITVDSISRELLAATGVTPCTKCGLRAANDSDMCGICVARAEMKPAEAAEADDEDEDEDDRDEAVF